MWHVYIYTVYMIHVSANCLHFKLANLSDQTPPHSSYLQLGALFSSLDNIFLFSFAQNIWESGSNIQVVCCNIGVVGGYFFKSFLQNFLDIQLSFPACLCLRVQNWKFRNSILKWRGNRQEFYQHRSCKDPRPGRISYSAPHFLGTLCNCWSWNWSWIS